MTKALEQVLISTPRLNRMIHVGNSNCHKCGKIFEMGDQVMKKKVRMGHHKYYHMDCYERLFY